MSKNEKKVVPMLATKMAVIALTEGRPDLTEEKLASLLAQDQAPVAEAPERLLTYAEVAETLRCSTATVRRMVESGRLKPFMVTEDMPRFRPSDVQTLIAAAA